MVTHIAHQIVWKKATTNMRKQFLIPKFIGAYKNAYFPKSMAKIRLSQAQPIGITAQTAAAIWFQIRSSSVQMENVLKIVLKTKSSLTQSLWSAAIRVVIL